MPHDRQVWASDLCLQRDIAERLNLNPTTVANLAGRKHDDCGFPRPVQGRGNRGIWLWPEVEQWWETYYPTTKAAKQASSRDRRIRLPRF